MGCPANARKTEKKEDYYELKNELQERMRRNLGWDKKWD